jgi:PAS domain S-box-containing protein
MLKFLSIRSFRMKLLLIIWISSTATLFLACGFFIFFEVSQFNKDLTKEIKNLSNFIADKSTSAIMFNDPAIAEDALLSVAATEPAIVNAVIYDAEANVVATYARDIPDHKDFDIPEPQQNTTFLKDAHLHLFSDIDMYSDRVGTVYIRADRHELYKRIQRYGVIVAGIMAVSLLFIALVSFILQKSVSKPVMALISSAKQVSEKKDYAIRVEKQSDDELGILVDAFNEMLAQIQESDSALRESRELFEEMASNIPGVIYQLYATPEGVYGLSYVSERAEEILGISSDTNGFYERFLACVADDDRAAFSASISEAVSAVGAWEFEGKFIKPSGESLWLQSVSRSMKKGTMFVANGVVIDITKRKKAEEELEKYKAHLENLVAERTARLEAAINDLSEFAYVVSHDLKAPLRGISQLAHWISDDYADVLDEDGKTKVDLLIGRVKRMYRLIDDILAYSRVGHLREKKERIYTHDLVNEVVELLSPPDNIRITIENQLPVITGDKTRVQQVFQNLLSNSIKFIDKPEGFVAIGCEDQESFWRFWVKDNGPGIEPKYHDKVFGIFQTLASHDDQDSTGIGLTLIKKIVEVQGGKIEIESEAGKGCTFYFTLPKQIKEDDHEER